MLISTPMTMTDILQRTSQSGKIFLVDDLAYNLRLLSRILKRQNYQVYQALDGATALEDVPKIMPDLILLDIKMQGIDGYQVCQQLKSNPQTTEIPVIFISNSDEMVDKVKAFSMGGVDYITKPFQPDEVILRVENQLNLRSLQRTLEEKNLLLEQTVQELKHTQNQLIQNEKMASLGQLVAGIAHEINNPVNFISGNIPHVSNYTNDLIELLERYQAALPNPPKEIKEFEEDIDLDFLSKDVQKLLNSITGGTERIKKVVQSLRNFSRLDESKIKKVDIHEGLESSLMMLQHRLYNPDESPKIQVLKHYGSIPKVECYAGEINQVFMSVLSNAIDALTQTHKNCQKPADISSERNCTSILPTIEISTELLNSEKVQITIADNGQGITEDVKKRLFDPFFTTKPVGHGTGLGLSISYQTIVEGHQGELYCQSIPGQGAKFIIILPIKQSNIHD